MSVILTYGRLEQDGRKFEVILRYITRSRLAWSTGDPVSKIKKKKWEGQ